jgi:hypothetical protein
MVEADYSQYAFTVSLTEEIWAASSRNTTKVLLLRLDRLSMTAEERAPLGPTLERMPQRTNIKQSFLLTCS